MEFRPDKVFQLFNGRSEDLLKSFPDNSIDALVTDPPAGISFMERGWDDAIREDEIEVQLPERASFVRFLTGVFREVFRVMKPGAHGLVWALPRTSHWTMTALEDAGFDIRDVITHHYGSGFPKNLNVSKAIDKHLGARREKVRVPADQVRNPKSIKSGSGVEGGDRPFMREAKERGYHEIDGEQPATEEAGGWVGWGTALKPASEHWILIRKPPAGSIAKNVLEWGTGALNIDGVRISGSNPSINRRQSRPRQQGDGLWPAAGSAEAYHAVHHGEELGRWPANLILSHGSSCRKVGTRLVKTGTAQELPLGSDNNRQVYDMQFKALGRDYSYGKDGYEEIDEWECGSDCPVARLDAQSGERPGGHFPGVQNALPGRGNITTHSGGWSGKVPPKRAMGDSGGASRFFKIFEPEVEEDFKYEAKASVYDRNAGTADLYWKRNAQRGSGFEPISEIEWRKLQEEEERVSKERGERVILRARGNIHATVKSVSLMSWLTRLVAPPNGIVLDCFMGSGTTGVAAAIEGVRFVGIEQDPDYFMICEARVQYGNVRREMMEKIDRPAAAIQVASHPEPATTASSASSDDVQVRGIAKDALMKAIKKGLRRSKP